MQLEQSNGADTGSKTYPQLAHCVELVNKAGRQISEREFLDLLLEQRKIPITADDYLDGVADRGDRQRVDRVLQVVINRFADGDDGYDWLMGTEKSAASNSPRPKGVQPKQTDGVPNGFAALMQLSLPETPVKLPGIGETGLVPTMYLRPYRDQPRRYFNPTELEGLRQSVVADGVRDIVKVRLLTEEERLAETEYPEALYEIVSGERRWRAAQSGGVEVIQIYVHEYRDEEEQFEDAYALNEVRAGLTPLEDSRALNRILKNRFKGNVAGLVRMTGKSRGSLEQCLCLVHLDEMVQAILAPEVPEKERLTLKVAFYLYSHCDHVQQRRFVKECFDPETSATQQILWIDQHLLGKTGGHLHQRYERRPDQGRQRIINFLMTLRLGMLFFSKLSQENRARLFRGATHADAVALREQADIAHRELTEWVTMLHEATQGIKHPLAINGMVEVDYYDARRNEMVRGTVIPLSKYKRLATEGRLAYQMQEEPRPPYLPDPDTIEED